MRQRFPFFYVVLSFFLLFPCSRGFAVDKDANLTLTGTLTVNWGDPQPGSGIKEPPPAYSITDDQYHTTPLEITEGVLRASGGIMKLNNRPVSVTVADTQQLPFAQDLQYTGSPFEVTAIRLQEPETAAETLASPPITAAKITGPQQWISIMCKFADVADEPQALAYFQDMYSSSYPGLDHYWREVSYDAINMVGSAAAGWYTLPHNRSYYVKDNDGNGEEDFFDRTQAARDCTAAATADVNFADYQGINLMFNAELDGFAWGGNHFMSLDNVSKTWPFTWQPTWGYGNLATICHEMGHAFGLPHSSGTYSETYDNVWDMMSDLWTHRALARHPTYNYLAQHTISYHKDSLNWIQPELKFIPPPNQFSTVSMERLTEPQTGDYQMIQIPIYGSANRFYTVEVRRLAGYDQKLPGNAVIIHEVDIGRNRPAHVIDHDGNGNARDAGTMMTVGDIFNAPVNGISVTVEEELTTGYIVTVGIFSPPQVVSIHATKDTKDTILSEGARRAAEPTGLRVSFDQDVVDTPGNTDHNDVTNPANFLLFQAGPDQTFDTLNCDAGIAGDDIEIVIDSVAYDNTTFQATLTPDLPTGLLPGLYRFNVCGSARIENINGDELDGNNDGVEGEDYLLAFEVIPSDIDQDTIPDRLDNCPLIANPNQADLDSDGQGNVCDSDDDNDTIPDTDDNCKLTPNREQKDSDGNGTGDACESDADGDGIADDLDNCPLTSNPDQADSDGNGIGDACTLQTGITFPIRMQNGTFILIRL